MSPGRLMTCAILATALIAPSLSAQPVRDTEKRNVQDTAAQMRESQSSDRATLWGLSVEEWERYESIMSGPRGTWSPGMDPVMVLGIHARTEEERRRYAEIYARQEYARVEEELAFQKAYSEAFRTLYPVAPFLDSSRIPAPEERTGPSGLTLGLGDRVVMYTMMEGCAACDGALESVLRHVGAVRGAGLDIFLVGSAGDDDAIRRWAARHSIPPEKVRSRQITLNHDGGSLASLGYQDRPMPVLLHRSMEGNRLIGLADLR